MLSIDIKLPADGDIEIYDVAEVGIVQCSDNTFCCVQDWDNPKVCCSTAIQMDPGYVVASVENAGYWSSTSISSLSLTSSGASKYSRTFSENIIEPNVHLSIVPSTPADYTSFTVVVTTATLVTTETGEWSNYGSYTATQTLATTILTLTSATVIPANSLNSSSTTTNGSASYQSTSIPDYSRGSSGGGLSFGAMIATIVGSLCALVGTCLGIWQCCV